MQPDRRRLLRLAGSGLALSATASLLSARLIAAPRPRVQPVALLVPLTGRSATVGLGMQRAATLAQSGTARNGELIVFDTQGTAAGAAAAAAAAVRRGARLILGPLFAAEVRPVLAAVAGRIPVLTFSNDATLLDSGAFLLGVTAPQLAAAVLRYARARGVRRVALFGPDSPWSAQAFEAARRLEGELGLTLFAIPPATAPDALLGVLGGVGGGELPDALLAPDGATLPTLARAVRGGDIQLLGIAPVVDSAPATLSALDGVWLAAPDPAGFADFARAYEARNGGIPGALAALAYDATTIAEALRAAGPISREGLLSPAGFRGVSGAVRFRTDGSCARELAILVATPSGYSVADRRA